MYGVLVMAHIQLWPAGDSEVHRPDHEEGPEGHPRRHHQGVLAVTKSAAVALVRTYGLCSYGL